MASFIFCPGAPKVRYPGTRTYTLTEAQKQRVDSDGIHVEERGRYHPCADGDYYHGQPFVVEHGRLFDKREPFDRIQRAVELEVERRYGGTCYDDLADEQYEIRHLK